MITSSLVGSVFMKYVKTANHGINLSFNEDFKGLVGHKCLEFVPDTKIFVSPMQIYFSIEPNKSGKYPSLSFSKMFEGSSDYVEKAIVF